MSLVETYHAMAIEQYRASGKKEFTPEILRMYDAMIVALFGHPIAIEMPSELEKKTQVKQ